MAQNNVRLSPKEPVYHVKILQPMDALHARCMAPTSPKILPKVQVIPNIDMETLPTKPNYFGARRALNFFIFVTLVTILACLRAGIQKGESPMFMQNLIYPTPSKWS
jgi:hypothetical protein